MQYFGDVNLSTLTRPIFGLYITVPDPSIVEMACYAGFRFVRIDMEHGMFSYERAGELIRTARLLGMETQLRISDMTDITKFLDMGATGIMVPDVDSREMVQDLVRYTKYAPTGHRGMFGVSPFVKFGLDPFDEYMKDANEKVLSGIQIESVDALSRIDDIIDVDGLDLVSSGKADLSQTMGLTGQMSDPRVIEAENQIIRKAKEHGKEPTAMVTNAKRAHELWDMGVRIMVTGPDISLIMSCLKNSADSLF